MALDHDQIFKTLIENFFQEFMELFLPEQAMEIDFGRIEFLEQEIFTDVTGGRRKQLDLVVKAGLRDGGEEYVLVHTEFQSGRDFAFPSRMFEYYCQLHLRYRKPIVPVAVFTDDARWRKQIPETYELGLKSRTYVRFEYHLIKLKHLDYRQFLGSDNPLAFALMAKMNYSRAERVRLKADFLRLVLGAGIDAARESLLLGFLQTYMRLGRQEESNFEELVIGEPEYRRLEKMITTYERRGMRKGRIEGRRALLILQLERKFGELDPALKAKVKEIRTAKRLESLALAVLDIDDIDQLDL